MGSTYNPLIGQQAQPRSRLLGRRDAPEPGVALVVHREGRPLVALADPTDRLTAGESRWANIKAIYKVDLTDHLLGFEGQLPCAGHASSFQVQLQVGCAVKDPVGVVARGVSDAASALERVLMDAMAEISQRFAAEEATLAGQAIRSALVERERTVGFSSLFRLYDIVVRLSLDEAALTHLRSKEDEARATDRTATGIRHQRRLEGERAEAERERDQARSERDRLRAELDAERVRAEARVQQAELRASAELERERDELEAERNRLRVEHEAVLTRLEEAKLERQALTERQRAQLDRERRWQDAVLEGHIERAKRQLELERADQDKQLYLQAIAEGNWQLLALQLTQSRDPDVVAKLIGMVREERQADLDRQLETLRLLLEQDALEGAQLAQIASSGKQLLQRLITTWAQPQPTLQVPPTQGESALPDEDGNDAG